MLLHAMGAAFGVFNAITVIEQGGGWFAALGWLLAALLMAANAGCAQKCGPNVE